ncbi:MAG: alpha/beta hydrolase [Thermoplasmata archaeon]|nr:alpha/beta hydrolase [Thermoplasmata archaeon]
MTSKIESGFAPVAGGKLYYETNGTGHPVVLVHAGIVDRRMWEREFDRFAKRYHVVRYDVRGFGRSERPTASYSDSDDLEALLRHLEIDAVRLVGVSNGGRIALDFAVSHPGVVESQVLVASGLSGYELSQDPEERAAFDLLETDTTAARELCRTVGVAAGVDRMIEVWARAVPDGSRTKLHQMMTENARMVFDEDPDLSQGLDPPARSRLHDLKVPTLVLEGELDQPALHYIADAIVDGIPGAVRAEIRGADHLVNISQPDAFEHSVLDFLE